MAAQIWTVPRVVLRGVVGVMLAFGVVAHAQDLYFFAPHGGAPQAIDVSEVRAFAKSAPQQIIKGGNLNFSIVYEDVTMNTNVGFDDPSTGATRQAALNAVLAYVDDILNASTGATLDVFVNASETDGTGALASAGSFFSAATGFDNGVCFEHIDSGVDPTGAVEDIVITVDFGYTWNSNHLVSPGLSQFDLFSVLLHEVTHGLGFLSLSNASGISQISGTNPGSYAHWDRLMRFNTSTVVWNAGTTALSVATSAFTSDNLSFSGSNAATAFGSQPPVYAPGTFALGSSLAHYKTGSVTSVMEHAIAPGVTDRQYSAVDIATLIDIGYVAAGGTPTIAFSNPTFSAGEGGSPATIVVNLSAATGSSESVMYATSVGVTNPATAGVDYTATSGTLNYGPTDTTMSFDITIAQDMDIEGDETITLTLSMPSSGIALGSPSTAVLSIVDDDDGAPGVGIVSQTGQGFVEEGETILLDVVFSGVTLPVSYQWYFDDVPLSDGGDVSGATTTTLSVANAALTDTGKYELRGSDASKGLFESDPLNVQVVPFGSLPAAGVLGLGLLTGVIAAFGMSKVRGRRR